MNSPASPEQTAFSSIGAAPQADLGPWGAFTDDSGSKQHTNIIGYRGHTHLVFSLPGHNKDEPAVRLIAAAPDLLDAAKLGLSIAKSWIDQEMTGAAHTEAMRALEPIRAAIARASGEKT